MHLHDIYNALIHPISSNLTQGNLIVALSVLCVLACFSGFNPLFNIEIPLVAMAWHYKNLPVVIFALSVTVGQMMAKVVLYYLGRRSRPWWKKRYAKKVEKLTRWCDKHFLIEHGLTFVSALIGVPPFYVFSIFLGIVRSPVWILLVWGTLGRFTRFAAIIMFTTHIAKGWSL